MGEFMFFDTTYENKIRWGHAQGVRYGDRYRVPQHAAELAAC